MKGYKYMENNNNRTHSFSNAPKRSYTTAASSRGGFRDNNRSSGARDGHGERRSSGSYSSNENGRGYDRGGSSRHGGSSRSSFGGGSRGGSSFGGARPFNPKRSFKADNIPKHLFINKEVVKPEIFEYTAINTFESFDIPERLKANLREKGYTKPSPIQDMSIPVALTGKDVIGIASTGTGKTAAFIVPLITRMYNDELHNCIILAPTRELAQQVEEEFMVLSRGLRMPSVACVGGAPIFRQLKRLERDVRVVVGTPGRVKDLIDRGKINMANIHSVVLDEADRMLDMGFIGDMKYILGMMPSDKMGLFFSATFSKEIQLLCHDFLRNPETISIKTRDTASSVSQDIIEYRGREEKMTMLHDTLIKDFSKKVLIFCERKRDVDTLADELRSRGFKAFGLHGDMRNRERERAVQALTEGSVQIVVATDVAARGIDIKDVSLVVNYDVPSNYDTYIHRIGRTGRANAVGHAITFVPAGR